MLNSSLNIPTLLTESDIKPLFYSNNQNIKRLGILALILVFTSMFLAQNNFLAPKTKSVAVNAPVATPAQEPEAKPEVVAAAVVAQVPQVQSQVTIPNNTLSYSSVNISSPIIWNTTFDNKEVLNKLQNGIAQINGTAKPGQKGVSVIYGHSSNYPWIKGDYNSVFSGLFKSKIGDTIEINFQGTQYSYLVQKIYEVKPTDLSVMNDSSFTGIRLITCSPLGTNLRRLIIEAKQVTPDPSLSTDFAVQHFSGTIPESR